MVRYIEYVKKMIEENQELFSDFRIIHDKYSNESDKYQDEFNRIGEKVQEVVKEYENRVCANTERGIYIHYSGSLAEKFQNEIRRLFPMIDFIGVKSAVKILNHAEDKPFIIKKLL